MENILDVPSPPLGKIFKEHAVWVGTFLGGPLVAGYFLAENFKTLGHPEKVKPTWIITILATVVIFGGIFFISESIEIPNQLIPIFYTSIAYGIFKGYQDKEVKNHIEEGGLIHSWGRVILSSIIGVLITLAIFVVPLLGLDLFQQKNIVTNTYGRNVKNEISYDKSNLTKSEVDWLAEGFIRTGYFDEYNPTYIHAEKIDSKYEIYISVVNGIQYEEGAYEPFIQLRKEMETFLVDEEIEFKLVVESLDNVIKTIK